MAEIVPIQLGLTAGNGLTLWASPWSEDGEEWEAFLGHGDHIFVFPDAAHLAAFIRTADEHDLVDHPQWDDAVQAHVDELAPDDDHRFDIVGVPELVSEVPDIWALAELSDTVAMLRSLAEVCDLPVIDEVLGSAEGFSVLNLGEQAFIGRPGQKLWNGIGNAVAKRWDKIIDALDGLVTTPAVDAEALAQAQAEAEAVAAVQQSREIAEVGADDIEETPEERDPDLAFWDEAGIDCLSVTVGGRTGTTLRCYLDDQPVFLTNRGRIQIFSTDEALERYITDSSEEHSLADLEVWDEIKDAIAAGSASVISGPENHYRLDGLAQDLGAGPTEVNAAQLGLAVELLTDAATARGDEESTDALTTATPLSNLIRAIVTPDPNRLAPAPPFDDEAGAFAVLVDRFGQSLDWDLDRE